MRYRVEIRSRLLPRPEAALGGVEAATVYGSSVTTVEVAGPAQLRQLLRRIDDFGGELLRVRPLGRDARNT